MAIFHSYVKLPEGIWVLQLDALAPKKVTSPSVVPWVFGDQEGLASGEGRALRLLAEIYAKQRTAQSGHQVGPTFNRQRWRFHGNQHGEILWIRIRIYIYIYIRMYVCNVM